jgi:hypothetical protein
MAAAAPPGPAVPAGCAAAVAAGSNKPAVTSTAAERIELKRM